MIGLLKTVSMPDCSVSGWTSDRDIAKNVLWNVYCDVFPYFFDTTPPPVLSDDSVSEAKSSSTESATDSEE